MIKIENRASRVKAGNTTFIVSSHFKEDAEETVDQKLIRLICQSSKNMITKPNS